MLNDECMASLLGLMSALLSWSLSFQYMHTCCAVAACSVSENLEYLEFGIFGIQGSVAMFDVWRDL